MHLVFNEKQATLDDCFFLRGCGMNEASWIAQWTCSINKCQVITIGVLLNTAAWTCPSCCIQKHVLRHSPWATVPKSWYSCFMTWTEGDKDITDMDYRNDITNIVCSARSWVRKELWGERVCVVCTHLFGSTLAHKEDNTLHSSFIFNSVSYI